MEPIIDIRGLSKRYSISRHRDAHATMRDKISELISMPFSFFKEGVLSHHSKKEDFLALRDISFSVGKGEVVGIIGKNGSGKSTLLKILSRIIAPTEGSAIIRGKVSSLLEVGTGFHPELSGRENIYLNGSILGMDKKDIDAKFRDIVDFSGVEKFLDTPVKKYSSGMKMRLAFSVAAHLEAEVLLIDEVLAVGDAEFQKKCLNFMDEATQAGGRTILFVSHNLAAIERLCPRTILLEKGAIAAFGPTEEVIGRYTSKDFSAHDNDLAESAGRTGRGNAIFSRFEIIDEGGEATWKVPLFSSPVFRLTLSKVIEAAPDEGYRVKIEICDTSGIKLSILNSEPISLGAGAKEVGCTLHGINLAPGKYSLNFYIHCGEILEDNLQGIDFFEVAEPEGERQLARGKVLLRESWDL